MAALMAQADLAVASFSVTAYELAAIGVPAIYLCLTADHAESASTFAQAGIGVVLGVPGPGDDMTLAARIQELLDDPRRRQAMAGRARTLTDGRGSARIAGILVREWEKFRGEKQVVAGSRRSNH